MRNGQLSDEAADSDRVTANDPGRSDLAQIGAPGPDERNDGREDVDWNRKQLRIGARVAETIDDGGNCGRKSVNADCVAPENDSRRPDLPVGQPSNDMFGANLVIVRRTSSA